MRYTYEENSEFGMEQAYGADVDVPGSPTPEELHAVARAEVIGTWAVPEENVPDADENDPDAPVMAGDVLRLRRTLPSGWVATLRIRIVP